MRFTAVAALLAATAVPCWALGRNPEAPIPPHGVAELRALPKVSGLIDESFVERFRAAAVSGRPVIVASQGGRTLEALTVANLIKQHHIPIVIVGACGSACAEVIMPAASRYSHLEFASVPGFGDPLVLYHHNPAIVRQAFHAAGRKDIPACDGDAYRRFIALRSTKSVDLESLWKLQAKMIGVYGVSTGGNTCEEFRVNYKRGWLPTSAQLKSLFGLKFDGVVCNDSLECIEHAMRLVGPLGETISVGNKEYSIRSENGQQKLVKN